MVDEPRAEGNVDAAAESLVGTVLSGKYRILRLIGAGGMGRVFVAEHVFTKREGALKLLHPSVVRHTEVVERFIREASAAGIIGSSHIVETFDAGRLDSGEPFIFMELLQGSSVEELLQSQRLMSVAEAADIAAQAARGLAAAHAAGIIHRDIKPGNLFVVRSDPPTIKLLDFGISKFAPQYSAQHKLTQEGRLLGTPYYMPPELLRGELNVDGRTDLYSLGVVLYEMLTGHPPFRGESLMELGIAIAEGVFEPVGEIRDDIDPALDAVIARAMAVKREERFADASEFLEALAPWCPQRPSSIPTPIRRSEPAAAPAWATSTSAETQLGLKESDPQLMATEIADSSEHLGASTARPTTSARRTWLWVLLLGAVLLMGALWLVNQPTSVASDPQADPLASPAAPSGAAPGAVAPQPPPRDTNHAPSALGKRTQVTPAEPPPPPSSPPALASERPGRPNLDKTAPPVPPPKPAAGPPAPAPARGAAGGNADRPSALDGLTVDNPFEE